MLMLKQSIQKQDYTLKLIHQSRTCRFFGLFLLGLLSSAQAQDFFKEKARGWHWYEDRPLIPPKRPQPLKLKQPVPQPRLTPTQQIEAYKKDLEQKLHQALVSPTPEHVRAYMIAQFKGQDQAQRFSEAWMRVVYTNPNLDYTATTPLNHLGRVIYDARHKDVRQKKIKQLAKTHGLFFFYQSNCPYCEEVAPVVKSLAEVYGFHILAVSLDGKAIPEFPVFQKDNGISKRFGITHTPALLAVDPKARHVVPVSYGFVSQDQMEKRLDALLDQVRSQP